MRSIRRRSFLKASASAAAASALPARAENTGAAPAARVVVVHGKDIPKMLEAGIAKLGGWGAFVKSGMKVTI